jgi:2-polyprenyl-6-methoxyphenol hydroxylase-like FAD-dependent oxidoreductase
VQASAKRILQPYSIEWETVDWYSVYPIGQGIADRYTLDHRVFLGGDACHTHSVSLHVFASSVPVLILTIKLTP